jgi:hypothetical protein
MFSIHAWEDGMALSIRNSRAETIARQVAAEQFEIARK